MRRLHVIPLNDQKEHDIRTDCWCEPTPSVQSRDASGNPGRTYFHHARDRRPDYKGKPHPNWATFDQASGEEVDA